MWKIIKTAMPDADDKKRRADPALRRVMRFRRPELFLPVDRLQFRLVGE